MPYAPPAVTTTAASLAHKATVFYHRKGLDQLKQSFYFSQAADEMIHPTGQGRTGQFYRFDLLGANTNPAVEGVIGNAIPQTSTTIVATLEEFNDFTSTSELYDETDISPVVETLVGQMSYRAAKSVDNIVRAEFDSVTAVQVGTQGAYFSAADITVNKARLEGLDVKPRKGGFLLIMHPYCLHDLRSDNTNGGFVDVMKYAQPQALLNGEQGSFDGCRIVATTNVTTSGSAPSVAYSNYLVGAGAVAMVSLAGAGPSSPSNPDNRNFKLNVTKSNPGPWDPAGTLGTFVGYRFVMTAKNMGTDQTRFRRIDADTAVV